ncbi:MAG: hypothetical protein RL115_627 [Bacteroidota bacterium]
MHINQLVKSLFKKESLELCSLQEVQSFADSNPHFGAAQLLLTKKLKTEKPEEYHQQLQKTFLYFHNPLWVEQLMNDTGSATIIANPAAGRQEEVTISQATPPAMEAAAPATLNPNDEQGMPNNALQTDLQAVETMPTTQAAAEVEANLSSTQETVSPIKLPTNLSNVAIGATLDAANTPLTFEPYHTVDYFAALGIKLKQDEKPVDKFGHQVKSFTDWLKVLRQTPIAAINQHSNPLSEKKVAQMAQHSLTEKEVITEAMAEVWAKQGHPQKAIDLYHKLSLQEPDKSVYFASLIDDLKKTL